MKKYWIALSTFTALAGLVYATADKAAATIGVFEAQQDVGVNVKPGSALFDIRSGVYRVIGGGAIIWSTADAFHFVYTKLSGDLTFSADVHLEGTAAELHRKAALMIRQSLDADSPYADVAIHGDGTTALQYRPGQGVDTSEFRASVKAPLHLTITRHGHEFTIYAGSPGEARTMVGPVIVTMRDPVYVGLAVCAHNANELLTAAFSNVQIKTGAGR